MLSQLWAGRKGREGRIGGQVVVQFGLWVVLNIGRGRTSGIN